MSIADKLITIAENQQRVYDAGFTAGQEQGGSGGYDEGFADGKEQGKDDFLKDLDSLAYFFMENRNWNVMPWVLEQDLSSIVKVHGCFAFATNLTEFQMPNRLNPKDMREMFAEAKNLRKVSGLERCTVYNRIYAMMFNKCTALTDVGTINFDGVQTCGSMFNQCTALEEVRITGNINLTFNIPHCGLLSDESIQSIIDHLADRTGTSELTLTLHATVGGKLTDAQKAMVTAKNWTLVY